MNNRTSVDEDAFFFVGDAVPRDRHPWLSTEMRTCSGLLCDFSGGAWSWSGCVSLSHLTAWLVNVLPDIPRCDETSGMQYIRSRLPRLVSNQVLCLPCFISWNFLAEAGTSLCQDATCMYLPPHFIETDVVAAWISLCQDATCMYLPPHSIQTDVAAAWTSLSQDATCMYLPPHSIQTDVAAAWTSLCQDATFMYLPPLSIHTGDCAIQTDVCDYLEMYVPR
ncbi:unnamed protein product [Pylaiella littoralis]